MVLKCGLSAKAEVSLSGVLRLSLEERPIPVYLSISDEFFSKKLHKAQRTQAVKAQQPNISGYEPQGNAS
jgi:hypothetical protein